MSTPSAWDYGRSLPPYRWSELPDFAGGFMPSPIRLAHATAVPDAKLGVIVPKYLNDEAVVGAMKGFFFENLHFEIEIDAKADAGGVRIGSDYFKLKKLHFHIPAEHTIDGHLSRMEVHLVHEDKVAPNSKGRVIGIMVEELTDELKKQGKTASPLLQFFRDLLPRVTLPGTLERLDKSKPESLNHGYPTTKTYFSYKGGLTTPPCSEPVFFHILDTPIYTTREIIEKFAGYVPGGNNRPLQPDNGREVKYFSG